MLNRLLRRNLSVPQLAGYSVTALIGMTLIFTAFGFSTDIKPLFSPSTGLFKNEYFTVTKKVSLLSAISSGNTVFSDGEIRELEGKEFVKSLSHFTPCKYGVYAYLKTSGNFPPFATEMFFESVPDRLLDGAGKDWKWDEAEQFVPVIIPRDYLALYNFGFAGSRGLPQISEDILKTVGFNVELSGGGKSEVFKSRIVGFSDYLNTILVPEKFMEWSNGKFGDSSPVRKSKLLVEVKNPASPETTEYFASRNYEVKANKGEQGKLSYFLKIIITVLSLVGLLILLPALGLMFLSINLLVYKNKRTLGNLILLGYSSAELSRTYSLLVTLLNLSVGVISFVLFMILRKIYLDKLQILNIKDTSLDMMTIFFVCMFTIILTFVNLLWIRRKIEATAPPVKKVM